MQRLAFVFVLLLTASAIAAPPAVTSLSPGGAPRGSTAIITAAGTFDKWPAKVWSSTPGITATADPLKGKFEFVIAKDAPLGVAWLRFYDEFGASTLRPFLVGGLPEVAEVEPNDDAKSAQTVTMPAVVNGVLAKAGDVDCFRVKLTKGQTLVASLEAHRTLRSPMDAVLQLLSDTGTVLEQNHDFRSLDPEIAFTAPADGSYVIRLFAFPSQPDSSIRHFGSPACVYRLTLTDGEFLDFATPLAAERERECPLALHGWNFKERSAKLDKTEELFGIAHPVAILREPHPCFDLTTPSDKALSPPFTATARLEKAGGASVVFVAGTAGKTLAIRVDNAGLALTPVLKVADATEKQLLKAEPAEFHRPIETSFTPPATAIYRFEVRDLFGTAGARHLYRLRVTPALPDVDAKVVSDRFTLAIGDPLDIPITVSRKQGFTGELVPYAEGLPEGVLIEVAPPPAKPDPNVIVLRLRAPKSVGPAGTGGVIRIGVVKKGDDSFRRPASATLADFDQPTSQLWLTVLAKR